MPYFSQVYVIVCCTFHRCYLTERLWYMLFWFWSFHVIGTYIDKKCPFTGTVSIRGRILAGTCHSAKMVRTIIVRRNYLHYVKKYRRYDILLVFLFSVTLRRIYWFINVIFLFCYPSFGCLGMRKGTQTSLHTYHHAFVWKKEIMLLLASAGNISI